MNATKNIKATKSVAKFSIVFGLYALVKFYLRGINSLSYVQPLAGRLQQARVGERVAVEVEDQEIGTYTVVAVRKSLEKAIIVTGWKNDNCEDLKPRVRELMDVLYNIVFDRKLSTWDIKKEKEWILR